MNSRSILSLLLATCSASSMAQINSVAPTDFATTSTTGSFVMPLSDGPRKVQLMIAANQLNTHLGRRIIAISFRTAQGVTTSWPPSGATTTNFEVRLSRSIDLASRTTSFSTNVVGSQTVCRTGPLTIPANSYPFGSNPNAFGPEIPFSFSYFYGGNPLMIEIRTDGFPTNRAVEAVPASGGPAGVYGTKVACLFSGFLDGTVGTAGNFPVVRIKSVAPNTVQGTVNFGQLGGTPYNSGANLPTSIPVSYRNAANVEIATGMATYNPVNGSFSGAAPGSVTVPYRVSFKVGFWLRKTLPNPASPAANVGFYDFGTVTPIVGDADDDNAVTPSDYGIWQADNGTFPTENTSADFDGDGAITPSDYGLWQINNGAFGDD